MMETKLRFCIVLITSCDFTRIYTPKKTLHGYIPLRRHYTDLMKSFIFIGSINIPNDVTYIMADVETDDEDYYGNEEESDEDF